MDAFAELGLERRLVLDDEALAAAWSAAGKRAHPDAGGTREEFERVGRARDTLARPVSRLRLWLELEGGPGDLRGPVSPELMDVFTELGPFLQDVDALLRDRERAASALARAMVEGRTQEARERLESMRGRLDSLADDRIAEFGAVERGQRDGWVLARELVFLEKWRGEIRERFARLW